MALRRLFRMFAAVALTAGGVSAQHALAAEPPAASAARQLALWDDPEWLRLLHYKREGAGWVSQVDDARFFNAPGGKRRPDAEMLATIEALLAPAADDDEHPRCRFPARLEWLQRRLNGGLRVAQEPRCALYREWRAGVADDRVTLVFPAYHLNSPSSMFGHTLLRLDPADVATKSDWLSTAVNFGAEVRAEDNSLLYAFKGLAGGYPGFFIISPYFTKIREYNQDEKRDIWEYGLNLRPHEIRFMVTHLWELKTIRFDYYFFDENCSYRLLELIEVARPGIDLTSAFGLTAIPVDTVRAVESAGLIESVAYRPAAVTVLEHLLTALPADLHPEVAAIADDPDRIEAAEMRALDPAVRRRLVDGAYRFLRHDRGGGPRDPAVANRSYRLLARLNGFPVAEAPAVPAPARPETGHGSRRLAVGAGARSGEAYAEIGFRMSFHSLEDRVEGFLPGAQINIGSLEARRWEGGRARLQRLDLVDIFSLTPRSALFSPWSWRVIAGLERQPGGADGPLVGQVSGGGGVAYAPLRGNLSYLLATARLEANRRFDRALEPAAGGTIGSVQHFRGGTAHLQVGFERFLHGDIRRRIAFTHSHALATDRALRLSAEREDHAGAPAVAVRLSWLAYFR